MHETETKREEVQGSVILSSYQRGVTVRGH